jgi:hypothetical protein
MAKQKSIWKSNSQVINIKAVFLNVLEYIAYGKYTMVILLYFRKNLIIIWTTSTQVMVIFDNILLFPFKLPTSLNVECKLLNVFYAFWKDMKTFEFY